MRNAFDQRPIFYRPLGDLSVHPALRTMPRLSKEDPRYGAMRTAWQESGVLPPLFVTAEGRIADGRHRYWFARDMRLEAVPVIEVDEDEVPLVIVNGLAGRNHTSKGQRAYLAVPYLQSAFEAAQRRRLEVLKNGSKTTLPPVTSVDDLAEKLGVGRDLLFQARRLHDAFEQDPKLREEIEPLILAEESPIGLGAALAGIAGRKATQGKARPPARNSALHKFTFAWSGLAKTGNGWERWNDEERDQATEAIRKSVGQLPDEALNAVAAAVRNTLRERKSAGIDPAN